MGPLHFLRYLIGAVISLAGTLLAICVLAIPIVCLVVYRMTGDDTYPVAMVITSYFWVLGWGALVKGAYDALTLRFAREEETAAKREAEREEHKRSWDERSRTYERAEREWQESRQRRQQSYSSTDGSSRRAGERDYGEQTRQEAVSESELKKLFRAAARKAHPDLAIDDNDRARRTSLMSEVNRAYEAKDAATLRRFSSMKV